MLGLARCFSLTRAASTALRNARFLHPATECTFVDEIALTPDDIVDYQTNGYLKVPQLLNHQQLGHWRDIIDNAVHAREPKRIRYGYEHEGQDDTFYNKIFLQHINLWKTDSHMADLFMHAKPILGQLACQLEQIPGVRLYHDQAVYKVPFANPTSWHVDMPYWSFNSPHAISVWIALDDLTRENGCMYFLPGSHTALREVAERDGKYPCFPITNNMMQIFEDIPELQHGDIKPEAIEMDAGDCIFHNGLLVHAAGPNMTKKCRRAMTFQLMPTGATFNGKRNIFSEDEFAAMKIGASMDDEERFPLMYSIEE
eukprot:m.156972 g.156972  ORF g.156972 m.156972 type:complete len:313 (+) comp16303_c2_seq1:400-1338(+)